MIGVTVLQVPASAPGAFLWPILPTPKATTGGLVRTVMYPDPVPTPGPSALVPTSMIPDTQPSRNTMTWNAGPAGYGGVNRNQMAPERYVTHADNMHGPVAVFSDNELPVRSARLNRQPRSRTEKMVQGGQGQLPWRRAYQNFPSRLQSTGYISQVGY